MIQISLDEGAAFDMLSIATIKVLANPDNAAAEKASDKIMIEILGQIGPSIFREIVDSKEYEALTTANISI